jgi:hypothetical protein
MDVVAALDAPCGAPELFSWVEDLTRYPSWLTMVTAAVPDGDAWRVDLRGRLGPLARSKRLRMVRTAYEPGHLAVFERDQGDGRQHSPWRLRATVEPVPAGGSHLEMQLHYGGALWGPVLERMLREEIDQGRERLLRLVTTGPTR